MRAHAERAYGPWDFEHQVRLYDARNPNNRIEIVVLDGVGDVGVVHSRDDGDGVLTIDLIEVHPQHQRTGIGRAVMAQMKERALAGGCSLELIVHHLNDGARRFYEGVGFREIARTQLHIVMRWSPVIERTTLWARSIEVVDGRATVQGEVWLGPVTPGHHFTATTRADEAETVSLVVAEVTEPAEAQEVGRVARVTAVLTGQGAELVRPGDVLLGRIER